MNLKLPTDPKERNQMLVLVGIVCVAALYGLYQLVSVNLLKPKAEKEKVLTELTEKIDQAEIHIQMMPQNKDENEAMLQQIKDTSNKYVLHPRLGNYLLPAKEFIESHAYAVKANLISVREIGITELPAPEPPKDIPVEVEKGKKAPAKPAVKEYAFKIYSARVSIENGVHDLIRLMRQIEEANPYACISAINIAARLESPDKHEISFDIQWPVWANNKSTENILGYLETADLVMTEDDKSESTTGTSQPDAAQGDSEEMKSQLRELGVPVQ